jgi:hypothetical protein
MSHSRAPNVPPPGPKAIGLLRVRTPCASLDQFVAESFLDDASVFVATCQPLPPGTRGALTLLFRSGESVRLGEIEVLGSGADDEDRSTPGVTLRFLSLEEHTRAAVERFHSRGTMPPPLNPFADPVLDEAESLATVRLRGSLPDLPPLAYGSARTTRLELSSMDYLEGVPDALTSVETQRHDVDLHLTSRIPTGERPHSVTPLPLPAPDDSTIGLPRTFQGVPPRVEDSGPVIEVCPEQEASCPTPPTWPRTRTSLPALALVSAVAIGAGVVVGYVVWGAPPPARPAPPSVEVASLVSSDPRIAQKPPAAAPVATAPKTASECTVTVRSEPEGASVHWDEQLIGTTPLVDAVVPCGEATLILQHKRYRDAEKRLTATPGAPAEVDLRLLRPSGTLLLESRPPGAQFQVNGRPVGQSPTSVVVSGYMEATVTASLPGFRAWSHKVYVKRPKTRLRAELVRR